HALHVDIPHLAREAAALSASPEAQRGQEREAQVGWLFDGEGEARTLVPLVARLASAPAQPEPPREGLADAIRNIIQNAADNGHEASWADDAARELLVWLAPIDRAALAGAAPPQVADDDTVFAALRAAADDEKIPLVYRQAIQRVLAAPPQEPVAWLIVNKD